MNHMELKRKINTTWIFSIAITVIFCLILIPMYRNQTVVEFRTNFDLWAHIQAGLSEQNGYSLTYIILGFLWKLPRYNRLTISLFLITLNILSIFFTYIILKMNIKNISNEYLYTAALACNIYMPIHIPSFNSSPYKGMLCSNLYHNSTYIAMKPFALLSVILSIKLMSKYHTKSISILDWSCFASCLFITTWFKPNFMFGFVPCMLIIMIIDVIKRKGKNILNYIIFGTTTFPAIGLMLLQKTQLFDQQSNIKFGFFKVWRLYSNNPLISVILSLSFPLIILIFYYKDLLVDKIYRFGWLFAIINTSIFAFLYESGERFSHGNLGWGAQFASGLIFIISMYKFLDKIKNMSKIKLITISSILSIHVFCGINYIIRFLCTNTFA